MISSTHFLFEIFISPSNFSIGVVFNTISTTSPSLKPNFVSGFKTSSLYIAFVRMTIAIIKSVFGLKNLRSKPQSQPRIALLPKTPASADMRSEICTAPITPYQWHQPDLEWCVVQRQSEQRHDCDARALKPERNPFTCEVS